MKIKFFATLAAMLCGVMLNAQKPAVVASDKTGWHKIAETTVNFETEREEVAVLLADKFASLKFKVTDAPMELIDIDVIFEEGDHQNIKVGFLVKPAGTESREIDLKGASERRIKRIALHYKTVDNKKGQKAHLEIWGRKTNTTK